MNHLIVLAGAALLQQAKYLLAMSNETLLTFSRRLYMGLYFYF